MSDFAYPALRGLKTKPGAAPAPEGTKTGALARRTMMAKSKKPAPMPKPGKGKKGC